MIKKLLIVAIAVIAVVLLITALRLYSLQKDVGRFRTYWQARANEPVGENALLYIALGDSTAQGIGASSPEKGYVGLVAEYLKATTHRPVRVVNLSVSGAKINDALRDQLPKLTDYPRPDVVTIQIGANDIRGFEEKNFRGSFKKLIEGLPDNTVISNVPSFKNGRFKRYASNSYQAKTVMDDILKNSHLSMVDLYSVTQSDIGFFDTAADFFHPNDAAYRKWADVFISGIKL